MFDLDFSASTDAQLMDALDVATNLLGEPLKPETRIRLFNAVQNPQVYWVDARSIVLRSNSFCTLWQAVLTYTDYSGINGAAPAPSTEQILTAITAQAQR